MKFRPPVWATALTAAAVLLFGTLASWQVQRGQAKADMIARRSDLSESSLFQVNEAGRLPAHGRRVEVSGRWLAGREVLLDNQTRRGEVGVHVWTPLRLPDSDHLVLVNRGWLPASPYREQLPDTGEPAPGRVTVTGLWRSLPEAGLSAETGACAPADSWPRRLNYPAHATLACLYDAPVADGLLLLDPQRPDGFARDWAELGIPPTRHYGYAVQWAALMLTALVLYVLLNLKRSSP